MADWARAQSPGAVEEILDRENKRMADSLASKVTRLKSLALDIDRDAEDQNRYLDGMVRAHGVRESVPCPQHYLLQSLQCLLQHWCGWVVKSPLLCDLAGILPLGLGFHKHDRLLTGSVKRFSSQWQGPRTETTGSFYVAWLWV
uniref:t-SNARE coiled-coil homology domain-containing protein n=1 Tax=Macaca fascicularis TaxID=9541 RepID=A0A7N9D0K1_MACFA